MINTVSIMSLYPGHYIHHEVPLGEHMKVEITLGDTPADCKLYIDGKLITNCVEFLASVDMESGPKVKYFTTNGTSEEMHEVDFNPIIEDEVEVMTIGDLEKRLGGKDG